MYAIPGGTCTFVERAGAEELRHKCSAGAIDPRHGCPIESKRGPFFSSTALPPRSTAGHLPLEQVIGVRIPGGQPSLRRLPFSFRVSRVRFVYASSGIAPKPYLEVNHGPTHIRESRGLPGRIGA